MSRIYDDPQRLTGQVFAGTLEVKSWQGRDRYEVACQHCGTSSIYGLAQIKSASACPNRACAVTRLNRPETDKTEQAPKPDRPKPLGSLKDFIESEREQQRLASALIAEKEAERARSEQETIDKLQREAQDALRKIRANEKRYLTEGKDEDAHSLLSEAMKTIRIQKSEVAEHNRAAALAFVAQTPEYRRYESEETSNAITGYMTRNGIVIFDAESLGNVFRKLRDAQVIRENAPQIEPTPEPVRYSYGFDDVEDEPVAEQPAKPGYFDKQHQGFDPVTGEPRSFSSHELDRLSADEFKRAMKPRTRIRDILRHV